MLDTNWLDAFLTSAENETSILRENGAGCQVEARERLLTKLREAATLAQDETVSVEQAVVLTGVNPETVRRAVRSGEVTDLRSSPKQTIRVLKRDLPLLAAKRRRKSNGLAGDTVDAYNAEADAEAVLGRFTR